MAMNRRGFTIWEMLVVSALIIILSVFSLANFRTARTSGERDTALKQIIATIRTARTMSVGGQMLANNTFPDGGYGVKFDTTRPDQLSIFALVNNTLVEVPNGSKQFSGNDIVSLCGSTALTLPSAMPCATGWENMTGELSVTFTPNGTATIIRPIGKNYLYVGGRLRHRTTGQEAYFYISLQSGLVSGGLL